MATDATPTRRPYTGSCHCGATKYIVFLTLPAPEPVARDRSKPPSQRFYRCNCTICHKAGIMHIRLPSAPDDFVLLSPLDPLESLGDYQCAAKRLHFFFCKTCGVRCFSFAGEGELGEVDLAELGVETERPGEPTKLWRAKKDGWGENTRVSYLSVNGHTIDAGQGFELRDLTELKRVEYLNALAPEDESTDDVRLPFPHLTSAPQWPPD